MSEVEKDYENACDAARPPNRGLGVEIWKYSLKSTDLKRSANSGFRFVGVFLEGKADTKAVRVLYLVLFYFKGDQAEFTNREIESALAYLKGRLRKQGSSNPEEPRSRSRILTGARFRRRDRQWPNRYGPANAALTAGFRGP